MDKAADFNFKITTTHGEVPNGLIPEFNGIIYYIQTNFAQTKEEHEAAVQPVVDQLLSVNEEKYTSWEETKREILIFSRISQVTVVSFRVRDAY
ncbi:hypothetical protein [Planococcus wigleyi]|uniref:Uncharacterized protein n=1 Tax=Planococcus wigleyi TaxID=2762216 RepID=A0ABR8WA10_9BACL|nr:hypothetical protein [Planococcus wigleyi]MBD8013870.1 hypothetical protein [Planococcus wigleyi]